ncbi:hypothetical protein C8F01DRAFT_1154952 [Mycena amicta]|nr:hypothetical protein C8F01DRAFT_1154952 [Mycena amicta]
MATPAPPHAPYPAGLSAPSDTQSTNGTTSAQQDPDAPPAPRRRGRPKGSKNKTTLALEAAGVIDKDKRPVAKPRNSDGPKRPVGRPRKERGEWVELSNTKPDEFLHLLLTTLDVPADAGPSLEDAFKSHLGSLSQPTQHQPPPNAPTPQPIPSLYSILKTFWLPSSPAYFSLTASAGTGSARVPSAHRFLYWDPLPLVFNGIPCPTCAAPLTHRGRIRSGPLTIHDLNGPFFVIGCIYACEGAGHAFASTDPSVRAALPELLEREFPARLLAGDAGIGPDVWSWQARGVSRALWNLVMGGLKAGLSKDVILQLVRTVQHGVSDKDTSAQPSSVAAPPPPKKEEEEEEEMEEDAVGEEVSPITPQSLPPSTSTTLPPGTQAFHEAWAANSVMAGAPMNILPPNAYRPVTFFQGLVPYDPNNTQQRKRSYPFAQDDAGHHPHPHGSHTVNFDSAPGTLTPGGATLSASPKPRAPRHCCKCGSQTCKGKGGRSFCPNACMDCGKMDCRGRNSRRPDRRCENVNAALAAAAGQGEDGGEMQLQMQVDPNMG